MFGRGIAHGRAVAVISMLYKIKCNPMHSLYGALPVPYAPVRVTLCALVAHRYTYAPPPRTTSYFFFPLTVSVEQSSDTVYSMMWDWRVSVLFYWPKLLAPFLSATAFRSSFFFILVGLVGCFH